jgi:hypothetical protein
MNTASQCIGAFVLVAIPQTCGAASQGAAAARAAEHEAASTRIVPTVEVLREVRKARQYEKRRQHEKHPPSGYSSPLDKPSDFPIMTVNIDPAEPADFVVMINKTRYKSGLREFHVVPGRTSIIVTRRGKQPCEAVLEVSDPGPNTIACQL